MSDLSARQIMDRLVAFPTVSRDSNLDLVDWVEEYLDGFGVKATRVYNDAGDKASIFANVGPDVDGGVLLSGHTDVVPVDGQDWSTDPFTVVEKDGRLYGRGTCDMKGFDALALAAVPLALEAGIKRPLQIALSHDEEVGCIGAPPMIDRIKSALPRASAAIIGEPSMMQAVTGHKANAGFNLHFKGFEVHSSLMHTGVSAVMQAARIIGWANRMNAKNRAKPTDNLSELFDPPWTTLHVGTISGGTAHNITAKDCRLDMDFRVVPGESLDGWISKLNAELARIDADMKAIHPETGVTVDPNFRIAGLKPEADGSAEKLVRSITGDNGVHAVSYCTEAGQFQERGYSSVICGPGDIAQAHQPDEYITVAQLDAGKQFFSRLIERLTV